MKETPIFEQVFSQLLGSPGLWAKVLVGSLLSFIPVVNFLAFGYLLRLAQGTRRTGRIVLPEWGDWSGLFADGLQFVVIWLAYWFMPVLLAGGFVALIAPLGLGALAYLLFSVVFVLASMLFCSALYRYTLRLDLKDIWEISLIVRMTQGAFLRLLIAAFVFVGIFTLSLPLYGFAVFFGFTLLIAYAVLTFRAIEESRRSVL